MLAVDNQFLRDHYDVVIVGSGYGGAITAARLGCANFLAGGKLRIAVLERGDEHPTGTFPARELHFMSKVRHPTLNPLGLYEYLPHEGIDVVQGCGLGGTSLINANVAIQPDREVLVAGWPAALAEEAQSGRFQTYFQRAADMLGLTPYAEQEPLTKVGVFQGATAAAGGHAQPLSLVVSRRERRTRYGVQRRACTRCGDCVTGCNVGAKNTLATNYLPMAQHFGVELIPRVEVRWVQKDAALGYKLRCKKLQRPFGTQWREQEVHADTVVLAAGSLGTTGILLRSQEQGLSLSPRLGHGFSGNGDFVAIAYNSDHRTDILGSGVDAGPRSHIKAGPTITVGARFQSDIPGPRGRYLVEDVSVPRALVDLMRKGFFALAPLESESWSHIDAAAALRWAADMGWNETGAANSSLAFLIMGHDHAAGRIVRKGEGVSVVWPQAAADEIFPAVNRILARAAASIGATYLQNPRWHHRLLGRSLITAHPLGGCATADDVKDGVVDHRGRVWSADGALHRGLLVADGAVIPRSLGVNPFMTISAFAERAAEHLRHDLGLPPFAADVERDDERAEP